MASNRTIVAVALLAAMAGAAASLYFEPTIARRLAGTEPGQRVLGAVLDAKAPAPPAGVIVAKRGDIVPAFALATLEGTKTELPKAWAGRTTLVNFWASWCAPCVREMPVLEAFYQEHRAKGWNMLGIAVDQPAAALRFLQQHPVSFPMAILPESNTELMRKLGNTAAALPFSLQFDHAGNVVERHVGELSAQELQRWFDTTKPQ